MLTWTQNIYGIRNYGISSQFEFWAKGQSCSVRRRDHSFCPSVFNNHEKGVKQVLYGGPKICLVRTISNNHDICKTVVWLNIVQLLIRWCLYRNTLETYLVSALIDISCNILQICPINLVQANPQIQIMLITGYITYNMNIELVLKSTLTHWKHVYIYSMKPMVSDKLQWCCTRPWMYAANLSDMLDMMGWGVTVLLIIAKVMNLEHTISFENYGSSNGFIWWEHHYLSSIDPIVSHKLHNSEKIKD